MPDDGVRKGRNMQHNLKAQLEFKYNFFSVLQDNCVNYEA
jgi:hypothetical protein